MVSAAPTALAGPFAPGTVSLRLYTYAAGPAEQIDSMRADAVAAVEAGFDGVLISEHHGNWPGYLPNPLQTAGVLLAAMPRGWAAPCPILPLIRPLPLLVEDIAWLQAAYPGRLGVGFAAGFAPMDYELIGVSHSDRLAERFGEALGFLTGALRGGADGTLGSDLALAECAAHPVPMLSAAMSATACRRAARFGLGVMLESTSGAGRIRGLVDAHQAAGGNGTRSVTRRVWIGEVPREFLAAQEARERSIQTAAVGQHRLDDLVMAGDTPDELAERLAAFISAAGVDSITLRVHLEERLDPVVVRRQIAMLGAGVVPLIRPCLRAAGSLASS